MMRHFFEGPRFYLQALLFAYVNRHKIWKEILIPWVITLTIFIFFFILYIAVGVAYIPDLAKEIQLSQPALDGLTKILIHLGVTAKLAQQQPVMTGLNVLCILISFSIAIILQSIVNKPFNSRLSFKVEAIIFKRVLKKKQSLGYFKELGQSLLEKIKIFPWLVLFALLLIPISTIPFIGKFIGLLLAGYYTGVSYLEYVFARRKLSHKGRQKRLRKKRWLILFYGIICLVAMLVPVANIFLFSTNIIAGTMVAIKSVDPRKPAKIIRARKRN